MGVNGTTGIGGLTLDAMVPGPTTMPADYDPRDILKCGTSKADGYGKQTCWNKGDSCCCTKKGALGGCKAYECCASGQACDDGHGCQRA